MSEYYVNHFCNVKTIISFCFILFVMPWYSLEPETRQFLEIIWSWYVIMLSGNLRVQSTTPGELLNGLHFRFGLLS